MWEQGGSEGGERKEKQETNSRLRIQHALQASCCLGWCRDGALNCLALEGLPSASRPCGVNSPSVLHGTPSAFSAGGETSQKHLKHLRLHGRSPGGTPYLHLAPLPLPPLPRASEYFTSTVEPTTPRRPPDPWPAPAGVRGMSDRRPT